MCSALAEKRIHHSRCYVTYVRQTSKQARIRKRWERLILKVQAHLDHAIPPLAKLLLVISTVIHIP